VGELALELERELYPDRADSFDPGMYDRAARLLIQPDTGLWAFVACREDGEIVGILTLSKSAAIYAGGCFGELAEFFVMEPYRSSGVGRKLVEAVMAFGRDQDWQILEVSAPDQPRWQRSVNFYQSMGFEEVGPRLELEL
jgi:GNAT superfamily N-acetyltransferase